MGHSCRVSFSVPTDAWVCLATEWYLACYDNRAKRGSHTMADNAFRAAGYPWRLYCGKQVIEQSLKETVERAGAKRAFVICSPSVNRRTSSVRRIEAALG